MKRRIAILGGVASICLLLIMTQAIPHMLHGNTPLVEEQSTARATSNLNALPAAIWRVAGSPYYISCEATIIGPPVDLQAISEVTGGTLYPGYVEWTKEQRTDRPHEVTVTNIYRIYSDNHMQVVTHGTLEEVVATIHDEAGRTLRLKHWLMDEFDRLKNEGAVNASSYLTDITYKSLVMAGYWKTWIWYGMHGCPGKWEVEFSLRLDSGSIRLICLSCWHDYRGSKTYLYINDELLMDLYGEGSRYKILSPTTTLSGTITIKIVIEDYVADIHLTIYALNDFTATLDPSHEVHLGCPGTLVALKMLEPPTMRPCEETTVKVFFDLPTAEHINITEFFPVEFSMISQVTLKKYAGDTLVATATIAVTPESVGDAYRFIILYTDAPDVLESLAWDEWVVMEYKLRAPPSSGIYEFPAAQIAYVVP